MLVYRPQYHVLGIYTKFVTLNFVIEWDCRVFRNGIT